MIVMEFQGPEQVGMNWTQAKIAPPSPGSLSEMPTPDFVHINLYFNNLSCDWYANWTLGLSQLEVREDSTALL